MPLEITEPKIFIAAIKQTSVGFDKEKIKERLARHWKQADKSTQENILSLTDTKLASVQRSYYNGTITCKLAVAISLVLGVNPAYLTGKSDAPGKCSIDDIINFLKQHNNKKAAEMLSNGDLGTKPKRGRKPKASEEDAPPTAEKDLGHMAETGNLGPKPKRGRKPKSMEDEASPADKKDLDDTAEPPEPLTGSEAVKILDTLYIKARFDAKSAATIKKIEDLLLS